LDLVEFALLLMLIINLVEEDWLNIPMHPQVTQSISFYSLTNLFSFSTTRLILLLLLSNLMDIFSNSGVTNEQLLAAIKEELLAAIKEEKADASDLNFSPLLIFNVWPKELWEYLRRYLRRWGSSTPPPPNGLDSRLLSSQQPSSSSSPGIMPQESGSPHAEEVFGM
jgi:hypothetical protein